MLPDPITTTRAAATAPAVTKITFPYPTMEQLKTAQAAAPVAQIKLDVGLPSAQDASAPAPAPSEPSVQQTAAPAAKAAAEESLDDINAELAALSDEARERRFDEIADAATTPVRAAAPAVTPTSAETKAARRRPLPLVDRLRIMEMVRAAPADKPDAELATDISVTMDRAVSGATIKDYRQQLGLKSVPMPSKAQLRQRMVELEAQLAAAKQAALALPTGG